MLMLSRTIFHLPPPSPTLWEHLYRKTTFTRNVRRRKKICFDLQETRWPLTVDVILQPRMKTTTAIQLPIVLKLLTGLGGTTVVTTLISTGGTSVVQWATNKVLLGYRGKPCTTRSKQPKWRSDLHSNWTVAMTSFAVIVKGFLTLLCIASWQYCAILWDVWW